MAALLVVVRFAIVAEGQEQIGVPEAPTAGIAALAGERIPAGVGEQNMALKYIEAETDKEQLVDKLLADSLLPGGNKSHEDSLFVEDNMSD